jgi:hypothetical protein
MSFKVDFAELEQKGLLVGGPRVPSDVIYSPPQGKIIHKKYSKQGIKMYVPSEPSTQTDLLANVDRRFVLPVAVHLATIFKVHVITDDFYRLLPDDLKADSLYLILSHSNVKKLESGFLVWEPIVVVIKQMMVVRARCFYEPNKKTFGLKEIYLWQNEMDRYYIIDDPRVELPALPAIVEKYVAMEGILNVY